MSEITIGRLFNEDRFSNITWKVIFLLLYSPVGILLAMIRMFMVLQAYVAASLLRSQVSVRRFILRVVCCVLGIIVEEDSSECKRNESARLIVSNHLSIFDHIPIHLLTNCVTFVNCDLPNWLLYGIGLKNVPEKESSSTEDVRITALKSELRQHNDPILVFPEEDTTSGVVGLLKFSSWWASEIESVQPVAVYLKRSPIVDIKASVLGSSWYSDYFWSFFVPYSVYTIKYLPVIEKDAEESSESFAERIQAAIAENMNLAKTNFTKFDKAEYEKRFLKDRHREFILNRQSMILSNHRELQRMVMQVAEVLPHVPREVIFRDLEITGNVDITITNLLENRIEYSPTDMYANQRPMEAVAGPSSSPSTETKVSPTSSMAQQHITFQERKAKLIEDARRRYKEKHNIP